MSELIEQIVILLTSITLGGCLIFMVWMDRAMRRERNNDDE